MDKRAIIETLAEKARAAIQYGLSQVYTIGDEIRRETHILNAMWALGKHHAYMDILNDLDEEFGLKTWVAVVIETEEDMNTIFQKIDKIYGLQNLQNGGIVNE